MIVPMKKVRVLCLDSDQAPAVAALQDLGLIHIDHLQTPEGQDLSATRARRDAVTAAQAILQIWLDPKAPSATPSLNSTDRSVPIDQIQRLDIEHREIKTKIEATRAEFAKWEPFGHFDLTGLNALKLSGVQI